MIWLKERAKRNIPMTMEDWAQRLDQFLLFDDRDLLENSGIISAEAEEAEAKECAENEFEKYRIIQDKWYESDFDRMIQEAGHTYTYGTGR